MGSIISNFRPQPFMDSENKNQLNDVSFIKLSLEKIDEFELKNGRPAPITPMFKAWLREAKTEIDNGGDIVKFKSKTVQRLVPDYSELINNTNRQNKTLERKGIFK